MIQSRCIFSSSAAVIRVFDCADAVGMGVGSWRQFDEFHIEEDLGRHLKLALALKRELNDIYVCRAFAPKQPRGKMEIVSAEEFTAYLTLDSASGLFLYRQEIPAMGIFLEQVQDAYITVGVGPLIVASARAGLIVARADLPAPIDVIVDAFQRRAQSPADIQARMLFAPSRSFEAEFLRDAARCGVKDILTSDPLDKYADLSMSEPSLFIVKRNA